MAWSTVSSEIHCLVLVIPHPHLHPLVNFFRSFVFQITIFTFLEAYLRVEIEDS